MKHERQEQIMQILKEKNSVSIRYLKNNIYASLSTLRRDLTDLEKSGRIKKYHGNITLISSNIQPSYSFRKNAYTDEKMHICNRAKRLLSTNLSVFIDSSSTTFNMCNHLADYLNIVAITNGLEAASVLSRLKNVNSFMAGGQIATDATSVVGDDARMFLEKFSVDIAFVSSLGLDLDGPNDADFDQAVIRKAMIQNARKTALLVDSSKFDNENYIRLAGFDKIDYVISEKQPPEKYLDVLRINNCDIIW